MWSWTVAAETRERWCFQSPPWGPVRAECKVERGKLSTMIVERGTLMEPHRLRQWQVQLPSGRDVDVYTCARPGRPTGRRKPVPDSLVSTWVDGLPTPRTAIISLLGRVNGDPWRSEFSVYTFCGGFDSHDDRANRPTFQEWLDARHAALQIQVCEHPTVDYEPVPLGTLAAVAADFYDFADTDRTVVIMDSGGKSRTGQVCKHLNATRVVP